MEYGDIVVLMDHGFYHKRFKLNDAGEIETVYETETKPFCLVISRNSDGTVRFANVSNSKIDYVDESVEDARIKLKDIIFFNTRFDFSSSPQEYEDLQNIANFYLDLE